MALAAAPASPGVVTLMVVFGFSETSPCLTLLLVVCPIERGDTACGGACGVVGDDDFGVIGSISG